MTTCTRLRQLTGLAPPVSAQDSSHFVQVGSALHMLNGDTNAWGNYLPTHPNTWSKVNLTTWALDYYASNTNLQPALAKLADETTVWTVGAFMLGSDIYTTFEGIYDPGVPPHFATRRRGLAKATSGILPFIRTSANYPLAPQPWALGSPIIDGSNIYFFGKLADADARVFLMRCPANERGLRQTGSWSYRTAGGWSGGYANVLPLWDNSAVPSVCWNPHLGKWLALFTNVTSPYGLNSQVSMRTADKLRGPWSTETVLYGAPKTGSWGSVYNVAMHPMLATNNKVRWTATDSGAGNVFLFETTL